MLQSEDTMSNEGDRRMSPASQRNSRVIRDARPGLTVDRYFTREGIDPFAEVEWELRDAVISGADGKVFFEQRQVEFPKAWSQTATNVVVQKYFRGTLGTAQRERSVKQMIARVADTIYGWGKADHYFKSAKDALPRRRRPTPRSSGGNPLPASRPRRRRPFRHEIPFPDLPPQHPLRSPPPPASTGPRDGRR